MNTKKAQPFTISRSNSSKSSFSFLDRSLSNSFDDPNPPVLKKQNSFLSRQNSLILSSSCLSHSIFKTDANIMPELLEQYSQSNLYYRDEEFTQQSETFITKLAQDKRIPKEFRAKFPLCQILVSICKIFMLNEYEIVVFSCTLDHCNWKIDEVVYVEEAHFLEEFPVSFSVEINDECKRFIIYLLIIAFSLKQYLNDKAEVDPIQAYCEKICDNFHAIFNRWTRLSALHKFNYSAPEINRKFRYLAKKEYTDRLATPKDYNLIADQIMSLTGSYASSKTKNERIAAQPQPQPQPQAQSQQKPQANRPQTRQSVNALNSKSPKNTGDVSPRSSFEIPKPFYSDSPFTKGLEKGFVRTSTLDSIDELVVKIPNPKAAIQRQESISQLFTNFGTYRRQESFDIFDKGSKKKVKLESGKNNEAEKVKKESGLRSLDTIGSGINLGSQNETEDYMNIGLPALSKKASNVSEIREEPPSLSRFNSNLSFLYKEE